MTRYSKLLLHQIGRKSLIPPNPAALKFLYHRISGSRKTLAFQILLLSIKSGYGRSNEDKAPEPGDEMEVKMSAEPAQVCEAARRQEFPRVTRQNHVDEKLLGCPLLHIVMPESCR